MNNEITLEQFVKKNKVMLDKFEIYWQEENKKNSEQFPLSFHNNNEGLWFEMFENFVAEYEEEPQQNIEQLDYYQIHNIKMSMQQITWFESNNKQYSIIEFPFNQIHLRYQFVENNVMTMQFANSIESIFTTQINNKNLSPEIIKELKKVYSQFNKEKLNKSLGEIGDFEIVEKPHLVLKRYQLISKTSKECVDIAPKLEEIFTNFNKQKTNNLKQSHSKKVSTKQQQ